MQTLIAEFLLDDPLADPASGRRFMQLLADTAPSLVPERWGFTEPLTRPWTLDACEEIFPEPGGAFLERVRGAMGMMINPRLYPKQRYATVLVHADPTRVSATELIAWMKHVASQWPIAYGHVHQLTWADRQERIGDHLISWRSDDDPVVVVSERDLTFGLPTLWWATVLGAEFIELIGKDKVQSCPAGAVEDIGNGAYWLQLTDSITDCVDNRDQVVQARAACIAHLGAEYFGTEYDRAKLVIQR
jgi:hypothetical protein